MHHHTFPADLVQAQRDWYATYRQLAGAAGTQTTVLRRRLVRLSVQVTAHPYWTTVPNSAPAARMQLKSLAWHDGSGESGESDKRDESDESDGSNADDAPDAADRRADDEAGATAG